MDFLFILNYFNAEIIESEGLCHSTLAVYGNPDLMMLKRWRDDFNVIRNRIIADRRSCERLQIHYYLDYPLDSIDTITVSRFNHTPVCD